MQYCVARARAHTTLMCRMATSPPSALKAPLEAPSPASNPLYTFSTPLHHSSSIAQTEPRDLSSLSGRLLPKPVFSRAMGSSYAK